MQTVYYGRPSVFRARNEKHGDRNGKREKDAKRDIKGPKLRSMKMKLDTISAFQRNQLSWR